MTKWPIKLKVGVYCAALTVLALFGAAAFILPYIYHRQLADLDLDLARDTGELIADIEEKHGPRAEWDEPLSPKLIPSAFRRRYLVIERTDGGELYRSGHSALEEADLRSLAMGSATTGLEDKSGPAPVMRNCRFYSMQEGSLIVRMGTRLGTIELMQNDLRAGFQIVLPIFGVVVFLGTILLTRRALRPVSAMTRAAERISAESPDERLPLPAAHDEIARLTVVLNESFDRLQRAYKAAARFSADASHQLKTPIAVLRAGLDEMRHCDYLKPDDREIVDALLRQTRRLTTLVEDLLLLAQADGGRLQLQAEPVDLVPALAVAIDDIEALGHDLALTIDRDMPPQLFANADTRRVNIILQNLGENAVKYNRKGGTIQISAHADEQWISIAIANTGNPIPAEHQQRLFDRFSRAGVGENIRGHGLGLNIARELARAHGGDLSLVRSDSERTEFLLRLPAGKPPSPATASPAQAALAT